MRRDGLIVARRTPVKKKPYQPRSLWPVLLEALLPSLYSARSIFLATYLGYYLRDCRASAAGSFVFGVEDFHTVWEVMLRQTLLHVEGNWNARLPHAVYETVPGGTSDA
ncbi:hypothetical protein, partial [Falsirhodobacter sp. alg1]|uniref:hypothetical protein n=1 Tax=Falsirhodobacter sp. alg1 TaxID=1472418 RepID=UPI00128F05AD